MEASVGLKSLPKKSWLKVCPGIRYLFNILHLTQAHPPETAQRNFYHNTLIRQLLLCFFFFK